MKENALWIIIVLLALVAFSILGQRAFVDGLAEKIPFSFNKTPYPTPTLSAGNAAAEATRVAQEQSAIMTAEAAIAEQQATTQAGIAQATRQAAEASQAQRDQEAAEQMEGTAQAIQTTAEHERFVAAATSAAEATRAQSTAVAATATRQAEEDDITATAVSVQATVDARNVRIAAEDAKRKENRLYMESLFENLACLFIKRWVPFACNCIAIVYGVVLGLGLSIALVHIMQREEKKCETKATPS